MSYTWTGGRPTTDGTWLWSDLTPFQYTNWQPTEPNSLDSHEDCLQLDLNGGWNKRSCENTIKFACKITYYNGKFCVPIDDKFYKFNF